MLLKPLRKNIKEGSVHYDSDPSFFENMMHLSWIELNSTAFNRNTARIANSIAPTQIALVVKSNAYGHGMLQIAALAQSHNAISWLCTAGLQEAVSLRKMGVTKSLLVLSYLNDDVRLALENSIHCALYEYSDALRLSAAAQSTGRTAYVHVKIDTGMSRLGVLPSDALQFIKKIQELPGIIIYGIFTHLCDTQNPDATFSLLQLERFDGVLDMLKEEKITIPCTHALSSSGLCIPTKRSYSLARIGASAYGLIKTNEHYERIKALYPEFCVDPVLTWKSSIVQIKTVPAGSFVGYNRTWQAQKETVLGILPVGYCDGYTRDLSNNGYVMINGQRAPVVGIISMNLSAIDLTHIRGAQLNDEVTLIGRDIPALEVAQLAGTITNEIVTRISPQLPRVVHEPELQDDVFKQASRTKSEKISDILK